MGAVISENSPHRQQAVVVRDITAPMVLLQLPLIITPDESVIPCQISLERRQVSFSVGLIALSDLRRDTF